MGSSCYISYVEGLLVHMKFLLLQSRNSVWLGLIDLGLKVLHARLGGVCTGRGLSCGAFWVISVEGELY